MSVFAFGTSEVAMVQRIYNPNDAIPLAGHEPPAERGISRQRESRPAPCPEQGRITDIERRVTELEQREPARDVIRTEVVQVPSDIEKRMDRIEHAWSEVSMSQAVSVPRGMAELFEGIESIGQRLAALEQRPVDITPASTTTTETTVTTEQVEELRSAVEDNSATVSNALMMIMDRVESLQGKCSYLTEELDKERRKTAFLDSELRRLYSVFAQAG